MNKGIILFICISSNFKILTSFSIIGSAGHIKWRYRVVSDNAIDYSVDCKSGNKKCDHFGIVVASFEYSELKSSHGLIGRTHYPLTIDD